MGVCAYTAEQDEWLASHYHTAKSLNELTKQFNLYFGTQRSRNGIQQHANKTLKLVMHHFTDEQVAWLLKNYDSVEFYDELTDRFNLYFGTNRSVSSIREKCNKDLDLKGKSSRTSYGYKDKEQLPLGTIRKSQTGTYVKVLEKTSKEPMSGYKEPYWLPLQKKLYQDAYGLINPNQMVCFLDGDPNNFELDNLYPIDRRISAILSKNHWWTNDRGLTLAAIKWCELYYTLKDLKGEQK